MQTPLSQLLAEFVNAARKKEYDPANDAIITLSSPGRKVLSREAAQ